MTTLVQLCEDGKLYALLLHKYQALTDIFFLPLSRQWRYAQFAINLLAMLIRHDHPLPTEAIKLHTNNLVHDALTVRKVGVATRGRARARVNPRVHL